MRRLAWISAAILLMSIAGCKPKEQGSFVKITVSGQMDDGRVPRVSFGIEPVAKSTVDHWRYAASYTRQGKTARFLIDLRPSTSAGAAAMVRTGSGSFIAVAGSENELLLEDLKRVLKANTLPASNIRVRELPFRFDILGENLDRGHNGNLVDSATGNWMSLRLYLGIHQDKEVILNLQEPGGTAEFLSSDPKFGNDVVAELAKVL